MGTRAYVLGLVVTAAVASSCASVARDTLVDAYNDEAGYDEACDIDVKTLAIATDAYVVAFGAPPESASDLVPDWIVEAPVGWDFDSESAVSFTPTVGGRCDGLEVTPRASDSIGQRAVDVIDDAGSAGCDTDLRQVQAAVETHFALNGYDAQTMADLAPLGVENEPNRWTLQVPADGSSPVPEVVATPGGPCDG